MPDITLNTFKRMLVGHSIYLTTRQVRDTFGDAGTLKEIAEDLNCSMTFSDDPMRGYIYTIKRVGELPEETGSPYDPTAALAMIKRLRLNGTPHRVEIKTVIAAYRDPLDFVAACGKLGCVATYIRPGIDAGHFMVRRVRPIIDSDA